jgi:hypothetical protein
MVVCHGLKLNQPRKVEMTQPGARIRPHEKRGVFLSNKPDINELKCSSRRGQSTISDRIHGKERFKNYDVGPRASVIVVKSQAFDRWQTERSVVPEPIFLGYSGDLSGIVD